MPEELKTLPVPFYLAQEEKIRSRLLYEQVFREDSRQFVDFYYEYKTRDNRILALEEDGQLVSMLHLNPYQMIVNGYEVKSNYIVAVATQKDYRHRGYMRMLLEKALRDMRSERMPFTFLMPASESIYAPFDFVWICPHTELNGRVKSMEAEDQNRYLASRYQMFCKRDERYMENLCAEEKAEEGESFAGEIPPYMARITDVEKMLRMVGSREPRELYLHVKDPIIRENDGWFFWNTSVDGSEVSKLEELPERIDLDLTIGELASMVFGSFQICLSEAV